MMKEMKHYEAPRLKVVSFKIESGFAGMSQNGPVTEDGINFGGTDRTGWMNNGASGDHSGMYEGYGYNEL